MKVAIIELHTFPSIAYMTALSYFDLVILEAKEHYNKRSFRNKFKLMTSDSIRTMSIPLRKGKHLQQPILETEISYAENWQRQHWRTITTNYGNSPYFEFYKDRLALMVDQPARTLYEYNFNILNGLMSWLEIDTQLASTCNYDQHHPDLVDLRNLITPKSVLEHNKYHQVFEDKIGFKPNLSILDLLLAKGPETLSFLKNNHLSCKL
jgi:hypothetical protein